MDNDTSRSGIMPVTVPQLPLEGGCQCGALRYRITARPLTYYACHCTICQRQSGSAFGASLMIAASGLDTDGEYRVHRAAGGSGREVEMIFCPACGNRIANRHRGGETLVVKPGTLDDAAWLRPAGHIFTATRLSWVEFGAHGGLIYEDKPDMPALKDRWRQMVDAGENEAS